MNNSSLTSLYIFHELKLFSLQKDFVSKWDSSEKFRKLVNQSGMFLSWGIKGEGRSVGPLAFNAYIKPMRRYKYLRSTGEAAEAQR